MDDVLAVQIQHRVHEAEENMSRVPLAEPVPLHQHVEQVASVGVLQHQHASTGVPETVVEVDDGGVLEGAEDGHLLLEPPLQLLVPLALEGDHLDGYRLTADSVLTPQHHRVGSSPDDFRFVKEKPLLHGQLTEAAQRPAAGAGRLGGAEVGALNLASFSCGSSLEAKTAAHRN